MPIEDFAGDLESFGTSSLVAGDACIQSISIAHYRDNEGYERVWYDVDGQKADTKNFFFKTLKKDEEVYVSLIPYYSSMTPSECKNSSGFIGNEYFSG